MWNKIKIILLLFFVEFLYSSLYIFINEFNFFPELGLVFYGFKNFGLLFEDLLILIHKYKIYLLVKLFILLLVYFYLSLKNKKISILSFFIIFQTILLSYGYFDSGKNSQASEKKISILPFDKLAKKEIKTKSDFSKEIKLNIPITDKTNLVFFILESVNKSRFLKSSESDFFEENYNLTVKNFFVPMPHTSSSIFSLFTSNYSRSGARLESLSSKDTFSLPFYFSQKGYKSFFLATGPLHFEGMYSFLSRFQMEIKEKEYYLKKYKNVKSFSWGIDDSILITETEEILKSSRDKNLVYYFFSNTHSPYFSLEDSESDEVRFSNTLNYDLKIINAIIKKYDRDTLFVILSDHGESFGEYGFQKHSFSLYNPEIQVPFYMIMPLANQKLKIDFGSILDITPSILSLFSIPYKYNSYSGQNIFSKNYQKYLKLKSWGSEAFYGIILDDSKWIYDSRRKSIIVTDLDENEIKDISNSERAIEFGEKLRYLY